MGFDAVWISPVSTNVNTTEEGDPYHGCVSTSLQISLTSCQVSHSLTLTFSSYCCRYWTGDLNSLNKHFGDENDLKGLVSALHSREMYLMLDVNVNHMGSNSTPANVSWLLPFMNETNYHEQCWIDNWNDQWQLENCWLNNGQVQLPDINTENQTIVDMLNMWVNNTVSKFNIDGVRLEAAKHIRKDFWPAFAANASVFTIGEVVSDDTDYTADYTSYMDSVLDYPSYFQLQKAFSSPDSDLSSLIGALRNTQEKYKTGAFSSGLFMENHDQPRFQSLTRDLSLIKNAMAWTFATDGMPIVYYGQEQEFSGAQDPDNREALWLSGMKRSGPMVDHVTALNSARKLAALTSPKFHSTPVKVVASGGGNGTVALLKPPMLALLSNSGNTSTPEWTISGSETGFAPGTTLVDVLTCDVVVTGEDGGVSTRSDKGLPLVLLPQSALASSTMCGNIQRLSTSTTSASVRSVRVSWSLAASALALVGLLSSL